MKVMSKLASGFAVFVLSVFCCCAAGQEPDKGPAKELVQYVRDAKKAGMKDGRIEEAATKAGWPANDVKQAIAYVHSSPKPEKSGVTNERANSQSKPSAAGGAGCRPALPK